MDWGSLLMPLASFGISTGMSFVTGKLQKNSRLNNKPIPYRNAAVMGTGAAAITGDPLSSVAAVLGGFAASLIHTGARKVLGK